MVRNLHFDSIRSFAKTIPVAKSRRTISTVDTLKGVSKFLSGLQGSSASAGQCTPGYNQPIENINSKLSQQQQVNSLIERRTRNLKQAAANSKLQLSSLKGIDKELFYGKAKIKVVKEISEQPSKAEEQALEYLQGLQGFDQALNYDSNPNSMSKATSADDLEKMGFQTKRQMNSHLQKKFGDNIGSIQNQVDDQIGEFRSQLQDVSGKVKEGKKQVRNLKSDVSETKAALHSTAGPNRQSFKVNPMRGFPFWQRVEKGYSWQVSKATPDGQRPAIMEVGATAGFRHTPRVTYGLGIALPVGLGRNWNNIRLSVEGVSLRSFATWEWNWGIRAYAGDERLYKTSAITGVSKDDRKGLSPLGRHHNLYWEESFLIGVTKSYRITSKWNGSMQLLYDFWWKAKGLSSPFIIRVSNFTF